MKILRRMPIVTSEEDISKVKSIFGGRIPEEFYAQKENRYMGIKSRYSSWYC